MRRRKILWRMAKHVQLKCFEAGRVRFVIHLVRMRAERSFHPLLEEGFFFKFAQSLRRIRGRSRSRCRVSIVGGRWTCAPRHHPLIGAVCILKSASHFQFDFMNERLEIADLDFHLSGSAQERTKFACTPANERGFVFPFEMMPTRTGAIQTSDRIGAIGRDPRAKRLLLDENERGGSRKLGAGSRFASLCYPAR